MFDSALYLDQLVTIWTTATSWSRPALHAAVTGKIDHLRDAVVRTHQMELLLGQYRNDHKVAQVEFVVALGKFEHGSRPVQTHSISWLLTSRSRLFLNGDGTLRKSRSGHTPPR